VSLYKVSVGCAEVRRLTPDVYFLLFSPSLNMYLIAGL